MKPLRPVVLTTLVGLVGGFVHASGPPAVLLARGGRALLPVVVAAEAPAAVREAAGELRDMLGRIAGETFELRVIEAAALPVATGVVIDVAPAEPVPDWLAAIAEPLRRREAYRLRSLPDRLEIVGATPAAVEAAVWDLLHRLGVRQFFPGETWEVMPSAPDLAVAIDAVESPDYATRSIWPGHGLWPENKADYARWLRRNRMPGGFRLRSGHAYGSIIRGHKAEFAAHPEYYALVDGERRVQPEAKLCIGNPAVRELVVRHCVAEFARDPQLECVSVDPSDGGGWCECAACREIGTPSDRLLTVANDVSRVLEADWPGRYVAFYAYNEHGPPPRRVRARDRVIVTVATAFLRGMPVDGVIEGWLAQGVRQFGIREYFSVFAWDRDLPGVARGSRLDYLARTIPEFHARGGRFMSAESSENFGPNGLGYYLAARMLWDVREAGRLEELSEDFLVRAFGAAREPMRRFYAILNGPERPLLSEHLVGQLYRLLAEAGAAAADDAAVRRRLGDLALYVRYVELFRAYRDSAGAERRAAHERLIRHAYRMRRTALVHSKPAFRSGYRDAAAPVPPEANWRIPEPDNPWKSSAAWTEAEIGNLVRDGIAANELRRFEPVAFGRDLVPASPLGLVGGPRLDPGLRGRGERMFLTWIDSAPATLGFDVTGGLIAHYRDRGPARLDLEVPDEDTGRFRGIATGASAPDGVTRLVELATASRGLHRLRVGDGRDCTAIGWPAGLPLTVETSLETAPWATGRSGWHFYVPKGTRVIGGYTDAARDSWLHDPAGERRLDLGERPGYFQAEVAPGEDGRAWSVRNLAGTCRLMTVPPYGAALPEELLLPREVVERDAAR